MDEEAALILEGKYDGLREFVLNVVGNFDNRLQQLEERSDLVEMVKSNENSLVTIEKRLIDVERSMVEGEESEIFASTPKMRKFENVREYTSPLSVAGPSTFSVAGPSPPSVAGPSKQPIPVRVKHAVTYPVSIADLSESIQEDIRNFKINILMDSKCKITEAQNAYILVWYNKKKRNNISITGKQMDVMNLMADGRKKGIWPQGFKPEGIKNSFREYLGERLRSLRRKEEATKERDMLLGYVNL